MSKQRKLPSRSIRRRLIEEPFREVRASRWRANWAAFIDGVFHLMTGGACLNVGDGDSRGCIAALIVNAKQRASDEEVSS